MQNILNTWHLRRDSCTASCSARPSPKANCEYRYGRDDGPRDATNAVENGSGPKSEPTEFILNSGKRKAIKRHLEALQTIAKKTSESKRVVN